MRTCVHKSYGLNRMWGCVCVVDVPYCVLRPSHNKQSFADFDEYKRLLKEIAVHMDAYTTLIAAVVAPDGDGRPLLGDNVNLRQMWCGCHTQARARACTQGEVWLCGEPAVCRAFACRSVLALATYEHKNRATMW